MQKHFDKKKAFIGVKMAYFTSWISYFLKQLTRFIQAVILKEGSLESP
jgi:hypothetical protein